MKKVLCIFLLSIFLFSACSSDENEKIDTEQMEQSTQEKQDSEKEKKGNDQANQQEKQKKEETKENSENEKYPVKEKGEMSFKGKGTLVYRFKEPLDESFVENITAVYLRETPVVDPDGNAPSSPLETDKISMEQCEISPIKLSMNSNLIDVAPEDQKSIEVVLETSDKEKNVYWFDVINLRPNTFTIRLLSKDGKTVKKVKAYTYDEMKAMAIDSEYYSSGCVMHGLMSFSGEGIFLKRLFQDAGIDFGEGMTMACRVADAPTKIEATETNSNKKTGEIFNNPQKYWIKPRYTDNYLWTYENLFGRDRYFVSSPWDDPEIGAILSEDKSQFSIEARVKLVSNPEFIKKVEPMIAMSSAELQYNKEKDDIREYQNVHQDLFAKEVGFRFLFGAAFDEDPTTNIAPFDKEKKEYPVVKNPEFEGMTALDEGPDACGNAAREAKFVFGIDLFEAE